MRLMSRLKNKKGFTLVEIIVVLVILAILVAVGVPSMIGMVNDARGKAFAAEARVGFVAAQAVVTEVIASGAGSVAADGAITWNTGYAITGVTSILNHPTFAGMVQDVTGAVYSGTALSNNPFSAVTVGTSDNRVSGITYNSNAADTTKDGFRVVIAGSTTTVSKIDGTT